MSETNKQNEMNEDIIRVRRLLEYIGPRGLVEKTVANSIHGVKRFGKESITATTLGVFPEVVDGWKEGRAVAIVDVFDWLRIMVNRRDHPHASAEWIAVGSAAERVRYALANRLNLSDDLRNEFEMIAAEFAEHSPVEQEPVAPVTLPETDIEHSRDKCTCNHPVSVHGNAGCLVVIRKPFLFYCPCLFNSGTGTVYDFKLANSLSIKDTTDAI